MPPKKRPGRPPGVNNKKKIKTENDSEVCIFCKQSYESPKALEQHLQFCKQSKLHGKDDEDKTYNCSRCNKKFKLKKNFKNHLKNEHSQSPGSVNCEQCSVVCPNSEVLAQHVALIHQREIFECEHCGTKFVRRSHVARHKLQKGCDGKKINSFPCEICEAVFTRKDNLMVHLRLQHIAKYNYSCKHCDYHTRNFSKLILHTQRLHNEHHQLECDHCGKVTGSRAAMTKHLEIHGEKKYSCDVCGYNTYTIEVMRRHVLTHVPDKPHKCPLCDRSYIQKVQLQRHMKAHAGHCCAVCGVSHKSEAKLLIHQSKHKGEQLKSCPFEDCSYYKKEFKDGEGLEEHIKKHYTPYECSLCKKRFNNETNMRRHLATHALEKPRRCMYCVTARAYVRGEHLIRHVRKSHPDVFLERLQHVRRVLGNVVGVERVRKSEMESILNVLDAESERILTGYGHGVLYGGLQELSPSEIEGAKEVSQVNVVGVERVRKSEMESILNVLDAESERILTGYGHGVLYGGLQELSPSEIEGAKEVSQVNVVGVERVRKSEMESILNVLDAESERILTGYGHGVLYGGLQELSPSEIEGAKEVSQVNVVGVERVRKSEMESILNVLDAESERILTGYGHGVLYGGLQELSPSEIEGAKEVSQVNVVGVERVRKSEMESILNVLDAESERILTGYGHGVLYGGLQELSPSEIEGAKEVSQVNVVGVERVRKSEMESILNVLDAESERILTGYGHGVLYGGLQELSPSEIEGAKEVSQVNVVGVERVRKSEMESILNVLDAESERILTGYGHGVLYGGLQELSPSEIEGAKEVSQVNVVGVERVRKSEMESILNVLDAESERILTGYGHGVLYGGLQELSPSEIEGAKEVSQVNVVGVERVRKSEMESILNVLDAESERILTGYGHGVLYGGLQELSPSEIEGAKEEEQEEEDSPLMSEEELAKSLKKLLTQLIDKEMLECFGWPDESIDVVLERVIENCGARAADRDKWTLVQRLRENAKHLFLYVIEDKNIARMMDTHTIDQIIKHILQQVSDSDDESVPQS